MADETKIETKAAAEAPAKVATAVADSAEKLAQESAKTEKTARARVKRQAKRTAAATKTQARRAKAPRRNTRTAKAKPAAASRQERNDTVTNTNFFAGFNGIPAAAPFQSLFADAGERSQEAVRRSQQATEELADIARSNVEALVEASRVAAEGARSIGQDVIAKSRSNVEQTADAIRSLAEAKSPTEFVQLQGEYARASFDRLVAESSKLTESLVKLAGEAIQPISNRATANAQRFNSFVA